MANSSPEIGPCGMVLEDSPARRADQSLGVVEHLSIRDIVADRDGDVLIENCFLDLRGISLGTRAKAAVLVEGVVSGLPGIKRE